MTELTHEVRDGVLILHPMRRIDSANAKSFDEQVTALTDGGHKNVVMDLSGLDYISSAGLRVILITAKRIKSAGGGFTLCGANAKIKDVIEVSGFATIFGMHANVAEAIAALG